MRVIKKRILRITGPLVLLGAMLLAAWGGVPVATAAEAGGHLSLNQAIDLALKEHPGIKQTRENAAAARYNIGVARSAYLPQVNFVANYYYGNAFSTTSRKPLTAATSGAKAAPPAMMRPTIISINFRPRNCFMISARPRG